MKLSKLAIFAAFTSAMFGANAQAQSLRQPYSLQPEPASVSYFDAPADEVSPSDKPLPKPATPKPAQPVPTPMSVMPHEPACGVMSPTCAAGIGCNSPADCGGCDGESCGPRHLFQPGCRGWQLTGFVDAGGVLLGPRPASRFAGPFNWIYRDDVMLNQLYSSFGKKACADDCQWDVGGRIDLLYGADYRFAQARGLELNPNGTGGWGGTFYGLALPQAYAEFARNDISVKVGHFYSIIGYEATAAVNNFFYSKSHVFQFCSPFTLTGALVDVKSSDEMTWTAGIHNGWDNFDPLVKTVSFIGGGKFTPCDRPWWASFYLTYGDEQLAPNALPIAKRLNYSLIWNWDVTCRTQYVFEHRYGSQKDGVAPGVGAQWYGINQYLFYKINDCWKAGARIEWFRDDDGTRVGSNIPTNPNVGKFRGNFYNYAFGLNWTPRSNLIIRPEIRFDDSNGGPLAYNDGTRRDQFMAAMDAIVVW